jgi:hypothetical protein
MEVIKWINLGMRFLLELCLLGALGYWGFMTGSGTMAKWGLGIGAPLLAATLWAIFLAPRSSRRLPLAGQLILEAVLFGLACIALSSTNHPRLGWLLAAGAVLNRVLIYVWAQ